MESERVSLKVGLLIPSISFDSAVETPTMRELMAGLSASVELHVFPLRYPSTHFHAAHGGAVIHSIGGTKLPFRHLAVDALGQLRVEHHRKRFDVLHAIWLHEPGTIAIIAGRLLHVPVLGSIGGAEIVGIPDIGYGALLSRRGRLSTSAVLRGATLVTGGSHYALRLARRIVPGRPADCFRLAPLPVDVAKFTPRCDGRPYDPTAPRLLHAASLIPVKDQPTLVHAFARIAEQLPGAHLSIAGEDPLGRRGSLERLTDDLGLRKRVTFLGRVPYADMPALYRAADLFLLTSRHESQGMVVLEAAASGVPTAGTPVGVVPDLAPDAALVAPRRRPDLIAHQVLRLLDDPRRLCAMGERGLLKARGEYATARVVNRFVALYEELVAGSRR